MKYLVAVSETRNHTSTRPVKDLSKVLHAQS